MVFEFCIQFPYEVPHMWKDESLSVENFAISRYVNRLTRFGGSNSVNNRKMELDVVF